MRHPKNRNPERFKAPGHATITKLMNECIRFAKARGYEFELTKEQWTEIVKRDCFYCGGKPVPKSMYCNRHNEPRRPDRTGPETIARSWISMNGIDRAINTIGYTISNSVACCAERNISKKDRSQEEFISHAKRVYQFNILQERQ